MSFPTRRQSAPATQTTKSSPITTYSLGSAAVAGNLLVVCLGGDKNTGTFTVTDNIGGGWTAETSIPGASVSAYMAWKVAAGGETTLTGT
ncbi:MAG: hypothetical protein L0I76_35610, partial [Pseudonocardia sp.]|nr:hypothetical protein [Pseudonocardia sp.]